MTEHTTRRDRMARHIAEHLSAHVFGPGAVVLINSNVITLAVSGVAYTITVCIARKPPKEGTDQ